MPGQFLDLLIVPIELVAWLRYNDLMRQKSIGRHECGRGDSVAESFDALLLRRLVMITDPAYTQREVRSLMKQRLWLARKRLQDSGPIVSICTLVLPNSAGHEALPGVTGVFDSEVEVICTRLVTPPTPSSDASLLVQPAAPPLCGAASPGSPAYSRRCQRVLGALCSAFAAASAVFTCCTSSGGGRIAFIPSDSIHNSRHHPFEW